jgi:hypothetical protein
MAVSGIHLGPTASQQRLNCNTRTREVATVLSESTRMAPGKPNLMNIIPSPVDLHSHVVPLSDLVGGTALIKCNSTAEMEIWWIRTTRQTPKTVHLNLHRACGNYFVFSTKIRHPFW